MPVDRNTDIGALLKSFTKKGGLRSAAQIKPVLAALLALLLAAVYIVFVTLPQRAENAEMNVKAASTKDLRDQVARLTKQLHSAKAQAGDERQKNQVLTSRFISGREVETFYGDLSQLIVQHGFTITGLKIVGESPVFSQRDKLAVDQNAATPAPGDPKLQTGAAQSSRKPVFHTVRFELDVIGRFGDYHNFLRELVKFDKIVYVNGLKVSLVPDDRNGQVRVSTSLSAIRLDAPGAKTRGSPIKPDPVRPISQLQTDDGFALHRAALLVTDNRGISAVRGRLVLVGTAAVTPLHPDMDSATLKSVPRGPVVSTIAQAPPRDPFSRGDIPEASAPFPGRSPESPKPQQSADSAAVYVVSGVILGPKDRAAIVRTDLGETVLVKIGAVLGPLKAEVIEITESGIVIREGKRTIRLAVQAVVPSPSEGSENATQIQSKPEPPSTSRR